MIFEDFKYKTIMKIILKWEGKINNLFTMLKHFTCIIHSLFSISTYE